MKCILFLLLSVTTTNTYCQSQSQPVIAPFTLIGNTIFIEIVIDGKPGNFILDTGAPETFLNSAYFKGREIPWQGDAVIDINGETSKVSHYAIKKMTLSGYPLPRGYGLVTDLRGLEESKGISIAGIMGYPAFKDLEILIDFDKKHLLLFPLTRKGHRTCATLEYTLVDSFEMKMSGHFPCIIAQVDDQKLRLGLDSGAEINVLNKRIVDKKKLTIQSSRPLVLKGMKKGSKTCEQGSLAGLTIGNWKMEPAKVAIADLSLLNNELDSRLDGMLGTPFLMQGKMAINYKQKKLYLWEEAENALAEKTLTAKKEGFPNGLK